MKLIESNTTLTARSICDYDCISPGGCELVTADQLFRRLDQGEGHRCMAGRAPEGYLEIWPDWRPVILHITCKENAKLGEMIDAEVARRKQLQPA